MSAQSPRFRSLARAPSCAVLAALVPLAFTSAGCTIVQVRDAATGQTVSGITVQVDPPPWPCSGLGCGQSNTAITGGSGLAVITPADPSDISTGYDLTQWVPSGWRRFHLSAPGYDPVVFYRDHDYPLTCAAYDDGVYSPQPCQYYDWELHPQTELDYPLLPDLVPMPDALGDRSWECVTLDLDNTGVPTDYRILRVAAGALNAGPGPLEMYEGAGGSARQRIYDRSFDLHQDLDTGGCIVYHPIHEHEHFGSWIALRVITDSDPCAVVPTPAGCIVAEQAKLSYEPRDTQLVDALLELDYANYLDVPAPLLPAPYPKGITLDGVGGLGEIVGMTPGWGDIYSSNFPSQYIRIPPGVPAGEYVLEVQVNPDAQVHERSLDNNRHRIEIEVPAVAPGACQDCTNLALPGCSQYAYEDVGLC